MRTATGSSMLMLMVVLGCGGQAPNSKTASFEIGMVAEQAPRDGMPAPAAGGAVKGEDATAVERKIIYTATLELVVKDIETLRPTVEKLATDLKGYVSKSDISGEVGRFRKASWTLKVPVADYRKAVETLLALGQPIRNVSDSQDVTEEFVDLTARVRNYKAEEETLNKLLKEQAVKMEDILKIREQIKVVRGEIERAEGRMKYLSTMAAMATIQLTAREDLTYVPDKPPAAPTFGEKIDGTFIASIEAVVSFGKAIVLFAVAVGPWLVILMPPLLLVVWAIRRLNRSLTSKRPPRPPLREPKPRRDDPTASSSAPPASSQQQS